MPWPTKKLGEVLELCDAGTWGEKNPGGMPLLRSTNIQDGKLVLDDLAIIDVPKEKRERYTLREGDILVTKSSGSETHIGKALYIDEEMNGKYGFSNFMQRLRVNRSFAYPKWIYHIVSNPETRTFILEASRTTSGLRNLNINTLKEFEIPLPPISEQKRIVAKIEKLFAKIDQAERLRREALSASSDLLTSALHHIFSHAKKDSWPTKKLGEICSINGGDSAPQGKIYFHNGTIPFVRMRDIGRYHITDNLFETHDYLTEKVVKERRIRIWPKGSILMPRSGSVYLNHRAILNINAAVVSHIAILTDFREDIWNKYLFYYLVQLDIGAIAKQTTGLDVIRFEQLKVLRIPLPPLAEQKKIVAYLDSLSARARELQILQKQTAADFSALRQSVLHEAFAK